MPPPPPTHTHTHTHKANKQTKCVFENVAKAAHMEVLTIQFLDVQLRKTWVDREGGEGGGGQLGMWRGGVWREKSSILVDSDLSDN